MLRPYALSTCTSASVRTQIHVKIGVDMYTGVTIIYVMLCPAAPADEITLVDNVAALGISCLTHAGTRQNPPEHFYKKTKTRRFQFKQTKYSKTIAR